MESSELEPTAPHRLSGVPLVAVLSLSVIGIGMAMVQTLPIVPLHWLPLSTSFYYGLLGIFIANAFLIFPVSSDFRNKPPQWFDWIAALLSLIGGAYLFTNASAIVNEGWAMTPSLAGVCLSFAIFVLCIEAARRAAGTALAAVCLLFGLFPLLADKLPGVLWGFSFDFQSLMSTHVMGMESIIGLPFQVVADLLIGYIVFGVALAVTGGGEFFMAFALKILGKTRGGPAKVSIVASSLFGSLSGSTVSNIITTGTFTIPSMTKAGYKPYYAAAIEACASTGGTLMPPIMGAAAFLMASFLSIPYSDVVTAAIIPSLLFYGALILQADGYAASHNLHSADLDDIPSTKNILRQSWPFVLSLGVLAYVLLGLNLERYAPWYATGVLIVCALIDPMYRARILRVETLLLESGSALAQLIAILAGVGLVVGSLSITGVGGAFARELLQFADGNVYLLLFFGALTSFVLGMGMSVSACYVLLAIILAPALVKAGLDPLASHLYILYWGMLSNITPPVAIAAITAATVGGANAMKTSFTAMKLGFILFIIPIFFVLQPTLIAQGDAIEIMLACATATISIISLSCSLSGWLYFVGEIKHVAARAGLFSAGMLLLYPEGKSDIAGLALIVIIAGTVLILKSKNRI